MIVVLHTYSTNRGSGLDDCTPLSTGWARLCAAAAAHWHLQTTHHHDGISRCAAGLLVQTRFRTSLSHEKIRDAKLARVLTRKRVSAVPHILQTSLPGLMQSVTTAAPVAANDRYGYVTANDRLVAQACDCGVGCLSIPGSGRENLVDE
eukprot:2806134-Rhodomonas_salina.3